MYLFPTRPTAPPQSSADMMHIPFTSSYRISTRSATPLMHLDDVFIAPTPSNTITPEITMSSPHGPPNTFSLSHSPITGTFVFAPLNRGPKIPHLSLSRPMSAPFSALFSSLVIGSSENAPENNYVSKHSQHCTRNRQCGQFGHTRTDCRSYLPITTDFWRQRCLRQWRTHAPPINNRRTSSLPTYTTPTDFLKRNNRSIFKYHALKRPNQKIQNKIR